MKTPKQKGHKVLTIFFLMAFIFSFSSFAYKVVDYEDFSYTAFNASDLQDHGWIVDAASGIFNNSLDYCLVNGILYCAAPNTESIGHKFNNVPDGYCMTPTGQANAAYHYNFSIRIDFRFPSGYSSPLDRTTFITNAVELNGKFSRMDNIRAVIIPNSTGGGATPYRFYWDSSASPFALIKSQALDNSWHTVQIDYIVRNETTPPNDFVISGGNMTYDGTYAGAFIAALTNTFDCTNVTSIRFGTDMIMDFDNLIVIEYSDGEDFIDLSEDISYYRNTLPYFDVDIRNHLGRSTTSVEINNDFTIRPINVFDAEGNNVYYSCVCDFSINPIFYEVFTDTSENIRTKYLICGNNSIVFYNNANMFQFPLYNNCTSSFIADLGINTENSIFYADSTIPLNSTLNLEFYDSSNVKRIDLAFRYNSSTDEFYIFKDDAKIESTLNFMQDEVYNFRVIFDFTNSRFQFGIFNSTYPINSEPIYYSSWHSFIKSYGIKYAHIYPSNASDDLIGNIILSSFTIPPAYSSYTFTNASFISCEQSSYFDYIGACFLSDDINPESLFNFKTIEYTTRNLGNFTAPTGSALESLLNQLFPSEFWKVFFGIFLVAIVTVLIMLSGMPFAWGVAIVVDSFIILSLSLIGLLPSWIPIFMAFIITFVVASFIRNSMITGGSD